jgi:hypothetical protein
MSRLAEGEGRGGSLRVIGSKSSLRGTVTQTTAFSRAATMSPSLKASVKSGTFSSGFLFEVQGPCSRNF